MGRGRGGTPDRAGGPYLSEPTRRRARAEPSNRPRVESYVVARRAPYRIADPPGARERSDLPQSGTGKVSL